MFILYLYALALMNDGIGFRLSLLTSSEGSTACQSEEDE